MKFSAAATAPTLLLAILLTAMPGPAWSQWLEASSNHFVIYADQSEERVRQFSERLQRFHDALRARMDLDRTIPSPSNRVTIYVLESTSDVGRLIGGHGVAGAYLPRAGGSYAFVPQIHRAFDRLSDSELSLLHEYTHHFVSTYTTGNLPVWLSEGVAEFHAAARFEDDGGVSFGMANKDKADSLDWGANVPLRLLFDYAAYREAKRPAGDNFYGKSWLLYHYLQSSPERDGQLAAYVQALHKGTAPLAAAEQAFGNLQTLDKKIRRYRNKRTISHIAVPGSEIEIGPLNIRRLRPGEAAALQIAYRVRRGGLDDEAQRALVVQARQLAQTHAEDGFVQLVLAQAEFEAGHFQRSVDASDAALRLDIDPVAVHLQKGRALASLAESDPSQWVRARREFVQANRLEPDNPQALLWYYRSFADANRAVPELAIDGLFRAFQIAPFDARLRVTLAKEQLRLEAYEQAAQTLLPLLQRAHGTRLGKKMQALVHTAQLLAQADRLAQ